MSKRLETRTVDEEKATLFGAFNARWISPEQVARSFVPTPHLHALVQTQHSLLMGPRGCGKTTLLKMLTRPAQRVWFEERVPAEPELENYERPDFEAVYIPSDVRWSYELTELANDLNGHAVLAERTQRVAVGLSAISECLRTFEGMTSDSYDAERICIQLIKAFNLSRIVPSFRDLRLHLMHLSNVLRSGIVRGDSSRLEADIDSMPAALSGFALDPVTTACTVFDETASNGLRPVRWAICFDEVEIAPSWLHKELLNAFRSIDQRFLLKLTWIPILPHEVSQTEEQQHDYATIRIWQSHLDESKAFCKAFATQFIRSKLRNATLTPRDVFGHSLFAEDEALGQGADVYAEGSPTWLAIKNLARRNYSFKRYLLSQRINPLNPISDQVKKRDECLRKIKPIVLLRETFRVADKLRSRKRPTLYAGEEAIYAMSDGNPRWLAGLLNELLDSRPRARRGTPLIPAAAQARVLLTASQRMLTLIKTYPAKSHIFSGPGRAEYHLANLVELAGRFFATEALDGPFKADPRGSLVIDEDVPDTVKEEIERGLLIGAFIYVSRAFEVPPAVEGARIRLSFMLAPHYRLLFRNLKPVNLSSILHRKSNERGEPQPSLFVS